MSSISFDAPLLRKLGRAGPRYTSYPTADRFHARFGYHDYLAAVAGRRLLRSSAPLSLYVHIPFCASICYYCACNKVVTRRTEKAEVYLGYLKREITMQATLFAGMNRVDQLHLGGGTPTYLTDAQMNDLMVHLRRHFDFAPDAQGEYAIEVDPRTVTVDRIASLRRQGFNRLSLGVQDYDAAVQRAVNRIQPEADTQAIIDAARASGFRSVNIDLIYGLPLQTPATMAQTLDRVIQANPDRIALYHYAHMPHLFKPQRMIREADMPGADTKLAMLGMAIARLQAAGYVYIGMDHFARPDDDLAVAQRAGRLHRNFQGYSTHADADIVAFGVSAIGAVGPTYSQNAKHLAAYYAGIDGHTVPIERGIALTVDDALRRTLIGRLMCHFVVAVADIEQVYPVAFNDYFAAELTALRDLEAEGLVNVTPDRITVTPRGRLLIRNICMVFDRHLAAPLATPRFSATV